MGERIRLLVGVAGAVGALLVAAGPASASSACPKDDAQPSADTQMQAVVALVCDVNALRAQNGLAPLRWDWRLWWVAQRMAADMAGSHTIAHVNSTGLDLFDRAAPSGYLRDGFGGLLTENLDWAKGVYSSPLATALGWMNSASHRVNLLDPEATDIGVGISQGSATADGALGWFYVAEFGNRGAPESDEATVATKRPARSACSRAVRARAARHHAHCARARVRRV